MWNVRNKEVTLQDDDEGESHLGRIINLNERFPMGQNDWEININNYTRKMKLKFSKVGGTHCFYPSSNLEFIKPSFSILVTYSSVKRTENSHAMMASALISPTSAMVKRNVFMGKMKGNARK